jgi:hypothetical protein
MRSLMSLRGVLRSSPIATATAAVLLAAAALPCRAAEAQTRLPILSACQPATTPLLPTRWRATALMLPYVRRQIAAGEFVYDSTLPAMRAMVYGLESGAADLLITDKETYELTGPPDKPTGCIALGQKYRPPTMRWLSDKAVCDGEAPVGAKKVQWWKDPSKDGRATWQWYRTDTRVPWRIMFPDRSPEPAVIGDYAVTYFPTFQPLTQTNLKRLRDFCIARAHQPSPAAAAATTVSELMKLGSDITAAQRAKRIGSLVPGLSRSACSSVRMTNWPHQFIMTAILSPIQFKWTPLPTLLYYDWDGAGTLVGLMHNARTIPPRLELESILKKGIGYGIESGPNGMFACRAAIPGAVRPDWMAVAGCDCKGVIDHNPKFGANEVSVIRACPVRGEGDHVNWSWYTTAGRPILFTEPEAIGLGLNIADYLAWLPGAKMPREAFALPKLCTVAATEAGLPPIGGGLPPATTENCKDCHTTRP